MTAIRISPYAAMIGERLAATGHVGQYDPRHIEAYMRLLHATLDGLSIAQFNAALEAARQCVDDGATKEAEALAESFGL